MDQFKSQTVKLETTNQNKIKELNFLRIDGMDLASIKRLSNVNLLLSLQSHFENERKTTHIILLHLKEIQSRKLYAERGYSSLFEMLIKFFKQSESAANQRLQALKLMASVPQVEEKLKLGELNLSTIALVQRQINQEEKATGKKVDVSKKAEIVERVTSKTMNEAQKELMELLPSAAKAIPTVERRISKDEVRLSVTLPDRVKEKMERFKNKIAHVNPKMDQVEIIERALDIALAKVDPIQKPVREIKLRHVAREKQITYKTTLISKVDEAQRLGANPNLSANPVLQKQCATESVAQQIKLGTEKLDLKSREQGFAQRNPTVQENLKSIENKTTEDQMRQCNVEGKIRGNKIEPKRKTYFSIHLDKILWQRANSQCEFVDHITNKRCESKFALQRDHIIPHALGGSGELSNLRLLCRTHNQLMARRHFGAAKIRKQIERTK